MAVFFDRCLSGMQAGILTSTFISSACTLGGGVVGALTSFGVTIWVTAEYLYPALENAVPKGAASGMTVAISTVLVPGGTILGGIGGAFLGFFSSAVASGCTGLTCCACGACAGVSEEVSGQSLSV